MLLKPSYWSDSVTVVLYVIKGKGEMSLLIAVAGEYKSSNQQTVTSSQFVFVYRVIISTTRTAPNTAVQGANAAAGRLGARQPSAQTEQLTLRIILYRYMDCVGMENGTVEMHLSCFMGF